MLWEQKEIRTRFKGLCFGCLVCDGQKCAGQVPGMGGVGEGLCFQANVKALQDLQLNSSFIHQVNTVDTAIEFFGYPLSIPILGAPIAGAWRSLPDVITEENLLQASLRGAKEAGAITMTGGGLTPERAPLEWVSLKALEENNGVGIPIFKPQVDKNELLRQIEKAKKIGCPAVGVSIDSGSELPCWEFKSVHAWKEIIQATEIPFIFKGVMSVNDAELAVISKASAIVVSNHGGRVLDCLPSTVAVLPRIVRAVGSEITILVDGGIRSGSDVLKMLALGADAVLIGRPLIQGAVMEGALGVKKVFEKLKTELQTAMKATGTPNLTCVHINNDIFFHKEDLTSELVAKLSKKSLSGAGIFYIG